LTLPRIFTRSDAFLQILPKLFPAVELLRVIEALEDKVKAQRKSLHMISIYRYKLDIPEQKIFSQGFDNGDDL
jgi:hypothetical protein